MDKLEKTTDAQQPNTMNRKRNEWISRLGVQHNAPMERKSIWIDQTTVATKNKEKITAQLISVADLFSAISCPLFRCNCFCLECSKHKSFRVSHGIHVAFLYAFNFEWNVVPVHVRAICKHLRKTVNTINCDDSVRCFDAGPFIWCVRCGCDLMWINNNIWPCSFVDHFILCPFVLLLFVVPCIQRVWNFHFYCVHNQNVIQ